MAQLYEDADVPVAGVSGAAQVAPRARHVLAATACRAELRHAAKTDADAKAHRCAGRAAGAAREAAWNQVFTRYLGTYPELAAEFSRRTQGDLPEEITTGTEIGGQRGESHAWVIRVKGLRGKGQVLAVSGRR